MTRPAISVEGLSKRYQIGLREARHTTFREAIMQTAAAPLARLKRLSGGVPEAETFWALRDVSFEVQPGEVVGIIGRNGAGKSTLLKVLSRITEPTSGRAVIRGRVGSLLEVGTGFHTELTGRENVYLNGSILGMSRREIERKFDEIVDFSGVEKFIDTPVKRYSSGMTVRLGFAVAAHLEPEILIVDEVLAVGDFEFQKKCLGKMNEVAGSGRTVLFVSHNMAAVEGLCTQGIVLERGCLSFTGSIRGAISHYMRGRASLDRCEASLISHVNRLISRRHLFRRIRLTDDAGVTLPAVQLGDPVTFELELDAKEYLRGACIGIHLHDLQGRRVLTCHTAYQATTSIDLLGPMIVRCRIPSFRLLGDHFVVALGMGNAVEQLDRIDPALEFSVVPRDVYGTGKLPPFRDGLLAPEVEWTSVPCADPHGSMPIPATSEYA